MQLYFRRKKQQHRRQTVRNVKCKCSKKNGITKTKTKFEKMALPRLLNQSLCGSALESAAFIYSAARARSIDNNLSVRTVETQH